MAKKKSKVVEAEVMGDEATGRGARILRQLLGSSTADKVEAARAKVREQFETRLGTATGRFVDLEKKVEEMMSTVQSTMQGAAHAAADKVREEGSEAVHKMEQVAAELSAKVADRPFLDHWLKLPEEVRDDMLTASGVASQKQVAALHEEVAGLREEIHAQFEAHADMLATMLAAAGHDGAHGEAANATAAKAKPKKKPARKSPAAEA